MEPKKVYYENLANTIIKNLNKRKMRAYYCRDKKEALEKIFELIPEGASIGWGGSETLKEVGIIQKAAEGSFQCFDRKKAKSKEEEKDIYGKICGCDYYFMSSNAITVDGELINIDGNGNRVAFLCFGPENVFVVVGMNKVVSNVEEGIRRTKNVAAPSNTIRLGKKTPCAITGVCHDCQSDDCICAQTVITRRSMIQDRITVFLIGEELGY